MWLDADTWLIAARSPFESGLYFEDGWVARVRPARADPPQLGAAVRAGLAHSTSQGRLPFSVREPWRTQGLPAFELGYRTLSALERAGVLLVNIRLRGSRLAMTPMRNEGAGRGYAGDQAAPEQVLDPCGLDFADDAFADHATGASEQPGLVDTDRRIGALLLETMEASRRLSQE